MAENREKLRATLQELEAELASLNSLDDETRAVLESVLVDIGDVLGKTEAAAPAEQGEAALPEDLSLQASRAHHETLVSRLQDAAEEFETSHPTLFGIVRRTIDALGQMGI